MKKYLLVVFAICLVGCNKVKSEYGLNDVMEVKLGYFLETYINSQPHTLNSEFQHKDELGFPFYAPSFSIKALYVEKHNTFSVFITSSFESKDHIKDVCEAKEKEVRELFDKFHVGKNVSFSLDAYDYTTSDQWTYKNGEFKYVGNMGKAVQKYFKKNK